MYLPSVRPIYTCRRRCRYVHAVAATRRRVGGNGDPVGMPRGASFHSATNVISALGRTSPPRPRPRCRRRCGPRWAASLTRTCFRVHTCNLLHLLHLSCLQHLQYCTCCTCCTCNAFSTCSAAHYVTEVSTGAASPTARKMNFPRGSQN